MAGIGGIQAHGRLKGRLAGMAAIIVLLGGCSTSSTLCDALGPSQSATLQIPQNAATEDVFACIDRATAASTAAGREYDQGHAIRDAKTGVLETTHYSSPNTSGFRLKAEVSKRASTLALSLRGAGAYCTDLGVDQEMARLTESVSSCLKR
ncbi:MULTISPECIES: hypothetical protein [Achromobacter]|jgi:hypothetical protein|uniref:Uncharacterized protein n=1 Tax=Achromobacter insuavis TaxID=1287735 RepID=A0A6J5ALW3_9BURK|nr:MULTISPECIES: hypothetical protein [Achromobacter]MCG2602737.1 hypothetical protein [Achromobacter sp.]CAB3673997.1 hypothetical protein LMG26845_03924 [Achromobacter insuavis]CAB3875803.1 hypothetical protein LMG26846_03235 [Achromobacter insuavis]CUJ41733.1 Uncharacterised protein [Achromobacter sp. 2789STDY5608633]CUJ74506.1 Uncharacterised protein [Achromobacter sp. 2789STDY5608628]